MNSNWLLKVSVRSIREVGSLHALVGRSHDTVRKRELQVLSSLGQVHVELGNTLAPALRVLDGGGTDDLDGAGSGAVATGHVLVHGVNGAGEADIAVLTVHIGGTAARVVLHPDAVVLDVSRVLLHDLQPSNKRIQVQKCVSGQTIQGSERWLENVLHSEQASETWIAYHPAFSGGEKHKKLFVHKQANSVHSLASPAHYVPR